MTVSSFFQPGARARPFISVLPVHKILLVLSRSSTARLAIGSPVCSEVAHSKMPSGEVLNVTPTSVMLSVEEIQQPFSPYFLSVSFTWLNTTLSLAVGLNLDKSINVL